ncbi:FecR family protein [Croceibacterium xixiisoli]|uniref:FecR family protein n=1 Tax=Croceibacterium xixiisoli TaxID=1476466 RepID=UPI0013681D5A|nr:FecR family protein [Croceibacterium xixiisoli]
MNESDGTRDTGQIRDEATRWFVRLHDDPADPAPRAMFEAWRDADPRHAESYARIQRLWGASGHLPSLAHSPPKVDRRSVLRGGMAAAASVAAIAGIGRIALGPHPFADHRTTTGERRNIALADGSTVELSSASALDFEMRPHERVARLLGGEAFFSVASDPARPFRVETGDGTVTALGTAFAVANEQRGVRVTVTEHAVQVQAYQSAAQVNAGQALVFGNGSLGPVETSDPNRLAWRDGRLAFAARPLAEVVAELGRWSGSEIIVLDDALAQQPVTLMIGTDDAASGVERIAAVVPMRMMRVGKLLTLLRAA